MSEAKETRVFSHSPEEVINWAIAVAGWMKYEPERLGDGYVKLKERGTFLLRLKDKGTIEVSASPSANGTVVEFRCANYGHGPFNTAAVRGQLQKFLTTLQGELGRISPVAGGPRFPAGGGQPGRTPSGGGTPS